ncbi:MAG: SusC/RagA family TonB-linked outer membrane protein, partial [Flammeovirgaceae bacterium]
MFSTPLVYNNQPGAYFPNTLTNNNLNTYQTSATELGLDVRFLANRVGLDVTYFDNIDGPRISSQPLASSTGFTGYLTNGEKTERKGWEVTVNNKAVEKGDFKWNVLLNWSTFQERWKEFAPGQTRNGFYNIGDRVDGYYAGAFYKTPDGQLINDAGGRPIRTNVAQFLGNLNPDWSWGFTNKFSYKNWGLTVQFDGRVGGKIVNYI